MAPRAEREARVHGEEAVLLSDVAADGLLALDVELVRASVGVGRGAEGALGEEEGEDGVRVLGEVGRLVFVEVAGGGEDVEGLCLAVNKPLGE